MAIGKKREIPPELPPPAAEEKTKRKRARPKRSKRPGTPLKGALAMFLIFVFLSGVGWGLFHFNLLEVRTLVIDGLDLTDEAAQLHRERLTEWETRLENDARDLALEEKNVKETERKMLEREAAADQKAAELEDKIAVYEDLIAQLQPKKNDITTVAKVIESMSAGASAAMLLEMTDRNAMIRLFSHLKPATQAAILETLDAPTAASLLEDLP